MRSRGNILFIKVIKSRKWKKNARNIILFRCSKALIFTHFQTFSFMYLPCGVSPSLLFHPCHFYSFIKCIYLKDRFVISHCSSLAFVYVTSVQDRVICLSARVKLNEPYMIQTQCSIRLLLGNTPS